SAMRSFMLPVGFCHSSLAKILAPFDGTVFCSCTNAVFPMDCRILASMFILDSLFRQLACAALSRKLCTKHFEPLNDWGYCQQVGSLGHESLGDGPVQVILPPCFIVKRVEDGKGARPEAQGEPKRSRHLLVGKLQSLLQEGGYFLFLAGFGFEACE